MFDICMKPKVLIFENKNELYKYATDFILSELNKKPNLVAGMPTGKTVAPLYANLVKKHEEKKANFSKIKVFMLDEYLGLKSSHKKSFNYFIDKKLLEGVNIQRKNINLLPGIVLSENKAAQEYENKIKSVGGIDLMILGIGVNGHIAFNEPGSSFSSRTRKVALAHDTLKSNFGESEAFKSSKHAITIGIATILESKKIILLATGTNKARAVRAMLKGPVSTKCPASSLRKHNDVLILLDKEAASKL